MSRGAARGRRVAAGLAAGVCLTLSLPPFGWWPLGPIGVAVLGLAVSGAGWRGRFAAGGAAGLGLYGPGLWWVTEFNAAGWLVLVLVEAAVLGAAAALVPGRRRRTASLAALPAALVLAEAARGRWPFGGLPLAGLDLGQVGGPLLGAAGVGGHLLVVAAVGAAGAGLAALAGRRWRAAAVGLGLAAAVAVGGAVAPRGTDGRPLRVAAVQGGGPRGLRAVEGDPQTVFDAQLAATRAAVGPGDVDVVLWPEDVVVVDGPLAGSEQDAAVARLADDLRATVVAGVVEDVPGGRFRNAAVVWEPGRGVVDRYDKVHRVPFGEYVPFRSFFDHLADLSDVPRDAIAGAGPGVLRTSAGRLGVVISYEVFFADRGRAAARAGGELLLVPTNASSYTTSQVPAQELAAARLRAVETGRWVVQAAPTGYSGVVDPGGRVVHRGPLGTRAVLDAAVRLRRGSTLAVRLGDLPVAAVALVALVGAWPAGRRRKVE